MVVDEKAFLAEHSYMVDAKEVAGSVARTQIQQFTTDDRRCKAVELPKGVMLRYNLAESLYFFLETNVEHGAILTTVNASNSPYEKMNRVLVSEVSTPMFEPNANETHLKRVEQAVRDWVDFVSEDLPMNEEKQFTSFVPVQRGT